MYGYGAQHSPCPCVSSIPMSLSPLLSLTDTQADVPGSSFPSRPYFWSPQPPQISPSIVQSPEVDVFWHEPALGPNNFRPKPELDGIPPYFLDSEIVDRLSVNLDRHSGTNARRPLRWPAMCSHSFSRWSGFVPLPYDRWDQR